MDLRRGYITVRLDLHDSIAHEQDISCSSVRWSTDWDKTLLFSSSSRPFSPFRLTFATSWVFKFKPLRLDFDEFDEFLIYISLNFLTFKYSILKYFLSVHYTLECECTETEGILYQLFFFKFSGFLENIYFILFAVKKNFFFFPTVRGEPNFKSKFLHITFYELHILSRKQKQKNNFLNVLLSWFFQITFTLFWPPRKNKTFSAIMNFNDLLLIRMFRVELPKLLSAVYVTESEQFRFFFVRKIFILSFC